MTKEHSHAQVLRWIADGKDVEVRVEAHGWVSNMTPTGVIASLVHHPVEDFRLRPRTIEVGSREINVPLDVAPEEGAIVYIIDTYGKACRIVWRKDSTDSELLAAGNVWATEADATAARDAWRELMKGQV